MNITLASPMLIQGENQSRTLQLGISPNEAENKTVRLAFVTPMGRTYLTEPIAAGNNGYSYTLPGGLTDRNGKLLAQIILTDLQGYCKKSEVFTFEVDRSIAEVDSSDAPESFFNGAVLTDKVTRLEQFELAHWELLMALTNRSDSHGNRLGSLEGELNSLNQSLALTHSTVESFVPLTQQQLNEIFV